MKSLSTQQYAFYIFNLIEELVFNDCYLKQYGKKFRAMDQNHNPIINVNEDHFIDLQKLEIIEMDGPNWKLKVHVNPFKNFTDIKIQKNETV